MQQVKIPGYAEPVRVKYEEYSNNGRLCVMLESLSGEPFMMLSCNVPEAKNIGPDEFAVKVWSENEEIARLCQHLFIDTGRAVPAGYAVAPIWRRRFDPKIVVIKVTRSVPKVVAIFDTVQEANKWVGNQTVQPHVEYTLEEVPYKP